MAPVGEGVSALRIDFGPGWRVYFSETYTGDFVLLLAGGDKSTQKTDVRRAKKVFSDLKAKQAISKTTVSKGNNR